MARRTSSWFDKLTTTGQPFGLVHSLHADRISKALGVEAVQAPTGGFAVRMHERGQRAARDAGKHHILRRVERDPPHLPRPETLLGHIHRDPAVADEVRLPAVGL